MQNLKSAKVCSHYRGRESDRHSRYALAMDARLPNPQCQRAHVSHVGGSPLPLGMIECVTSASQVVLRTSTIFCLIVQLTLTSGTVMPPFSMAFKQFLLSSTATTLVC